MRDSVSDIRINCALCNGVFDSIDPVVDPYCEGCVLEIEQASQELPVRRSQFREIFKDLPF